MAITKEHCRPVEKVQGFLSLPAVFAATEHCFYEVLHFVLCNYTKVGIGGLLGVAYKFFAK